MSQPKTRHTEKLLKGLAKKTTKSIGNKNQAVGISDLRNQFQTIRKDLLKLREDLQKGYDMAKGAVEKKSLLREMLRNR